MKMVTRYLGMVWEWSWFVRFWSKPLYIAVLLDVADEGPLNVRPVYWLGPLGVWVPGESLE